GRRHVRRALAGDGARPRVRARAPGRGLPSRRLPPPRVPGWGPAGGRAAGGAGLFLVVGPSLEVYPVAGLPEEALAAGAALAIVNKGPTPYDPRADLTIDAPAGSTLSAVTQLLV